MGLQLQRGKFAKTRIVLFITIAIALVAVPFSTHLQTFKAYAEESDIKAPRFINGTHYVHANTEANQHDLAAEIEFYPGTTKIELSVDDGPVSSKNVTDPDTESLKMVEANRLNVYMPFIPGVHKITGIAYVGGEKFDITNEDGTDKGEAIISASPIAEYLTPTDEEQAFKIGANPLNLKIDNTFNQFAGAEVEIHAGTLQNPGALVDTFILSDGSCNVSDDGFMYCNLDKATNWHSLAEGTYFAKLKLSVHSDVEHAHEISFDNKAYWSHSFVVDSTPPKATVDGPFLVIGGEELTVNGTIDTSAVGATVYIDDQAAGAATLDGAGKWTYDLKADLDIGDHKVSILAKDAAGNENDPVASQTTLTVRPFMPPAAAVTPVIESANGLRDPFPTIKESDAELNQAAATKVQASDIATLDKKMIIDPAVDQNAVPIASTSEGWKLFGIAWYWLFLVPLAVGGVVWLIARIRTPQTLPSFIVDSEDI